MDQVYNIKCDNCQSNIEISISPPSSLIHLTCLKCHVVIFDNQLDKKSKLKVIKNRYEIQKQIVKNREICTYLAVDLQLNKNVFLRMYSSGHKSDCFLKRTLVEACKLQHPNLLRFLDTGISEEKIYSVYEYYEGFTFEEYLQKNTILPRHAIAIAQQILHALVYLHERNFLCHEIKSEDIIITKSRKVKLQNFCNDQVLSEDIRNNLSVPFTTSIYNMPLEQIRKSKDRTAKSNIYYIGALLYYSLSGVHPFSERGKTLDKLFYAKLKNDYIRLPERNSCLSDEIVNVVETAMHIDPEKRYTAKEMINELQSISKKENKSKPQPVNQETIDKLFSYHDEATVFTSQTSMEMDFEDVQPETVSKLVNNRYLLKSQIGKRTFHVFDQHQNRYCVMKIIREIVEISHLDSVNDIAKQPSNFIAKWHEYELNSNSTLVLEEYISGQNFQTLLQQGKTFLPHKAIDLVIEILKIFDYLHKNQIACGCLELDDLLIGNNQRTYITDVFIHHINNHIIAKKPLSELMNRDVDFAMKVLQHLLGLSGKQKPIFEIIQSLALQKIETLLDEALLGISAKNLYLKLEKIELLYNLECLSCGWCYTIPEDEPLVCKICKTVLENVGREEAFKYELDPKRSPFAKTFKVYDQNNHYYIAEALEGVDQEKIAKLKELDSPRIVKYVDFWSGKDKTIIIYEPNENSDLTKILNDKSISLFYASTIITEIALGLNDLNSIDCAHHNLAPRNIKIIDNAVQLVNIKLCTSQIQDKKYISPEPCPHQDLYALAKIIEEIFSHDSLNKYASKLSSVIPKIANGVINIQEFLSEFKSIVSKF